MDRKVMSLTLLAGAALAAAVQAEGREGLWDKASFWELNQSSPKAFYQVRNISSLDRGEILELRYDFKESGWSEANKPLDDGFSAHLPVAFMVKAAATCTLEIKFTDADGSVFGQRLSLKDRFSDWTRMVIYPSDMEYWWGGDDKMNAPRTFTLAMAGQGTGTIWVDDIGPGQKGDVSFFAKATTLDPDRDLEGYGFRQRRHRVMTPEDPGVLAWLKHQQDTGSPEKALVPSMEDSMGQTFNNALAAMAFIVKGERERAERILDFYAKATDRGNGDPRRQNFFCNGQPRGFYQQVLMRPGDRPAYCAVPHNDRWMGDMAWLLIAYKHYDKTYGGKKYAEVTGLLLDLLKSFYVKDGEGGYIASGWRNDDATLHEPHGHLEGNVDAYAVMKLFGEKKLAADIRKWLSSRLQGKSLPLDLYTWRVMAFGKEAADALAIPEQDFKYRKIVASNGKKVMGFHSFAREGEDIVWLDGTGHMAVAHFAAGDHPRGRFYANQYDNFLMTRPGGRSLPYVAKAEGDFSWVDVKKGFVSTACWYIFAKNAFNPLALETYRVKDEAGKD